MLAGMLLAVLCYRTIYEKMYQTANLNNKVGFLEDKRRLNVMLTRARRGLIVFGCKDTLTSSIHWRKWIEWCEARKIIINEDL